MPKITCSGVFKIVLAISATTVAVFLGWSAPSWGQASANHPVDTDLTSQGFGINLDDPKTFEPEFDRVADSHSRWVRLSATWKWLEPQEGHFNWSFFDAQVAFARKRGLQIMATFVWIPGWANGTDENCDFWAGTHNCQVPPRGTAFTDFVRAVVTRYKDDIKFWGVWNEPNLPTFWDGTRQQYTDLILRPGIETIRSVDPDAKVVAPDLSYANPPWYFDLDPFYNPDSDYPPDWKAWIDGIMRSDVGSQIDVVSQHIYQNRAGDVISVMEDFERHLAHDGHSDKPVWLTETAFNSCGDNHDETRQWIETINLINLGMKKYSWWKNIIYYRLMDSDDSESKHSCKNLAGPTPGLLPKMSLKGLPDLLGPGALPDPNYSANSPELAAALRSQMLAAVIADGNGTWSNLPRLNKYQWNYYYNQVAGENGPDYDLALYAQQLRDPADSDGTLSYDDWWNLVHDFARIPSSVATH